ncbi:MAG: polyketide synthase [Chloroflexi bacterium]|nr:polyketide synthase [Chloroflexota bacterium]
MAEITPEQSTNDVVHLAQLGDGVGEITMRDTVTKNGSSPEIIQGLTDSFRCVGADDAYKVVILTGYGNYFLSGGTKEDLQQLQSGRRSTAMFIDLVRLIVDCPIPVIAAMQGHGIGGGFVLGLHADLVILARESIYTTNFLKYGGTPGVGATIVVPAKLGPLLGHEMLFTARNYSGGELAQRGVTCPVLPRPEVLPYARQMAQTIADAPRASLVNLKQLLTAPWRATFYAQLANEMAIFATTMQQPEIAERIETRFGQ